MSDTTQTNDSNTLDALDCISRKERVMTNLNYGEMETYEPRDNKPETTMSILENMDAILKELGTALRQIDNAIYSPSNDGCDANEPRDECLLGMLNRQRNQAESLLRIAMHIREGLW